MKAIDYTRLLAMGRAHWGKGLLLIVLLTVAVLAGRRLFFGPQVAVEKVVQRDFVQTVVASARVETPHRIEVGVQITGTVKQVPVNEGQTVAAGTSLLELESAELKAALSQAVLAAEQAKAKLRQLREVQAPVAEQTLLQARANHDSAALTLQRNKELFAKGFIGQAALDESVRAEQVAAFQLRSAQQQLATAQPGGSDVALAVANLAQAQSGVDLARARLEYALVKAPVGGTLIARNVEPGDVVQPGKALMVLSPAGETQLVAQIDEKNIGLLQLGQKAVASADAYPNQTFEAELVYVNPGVDSQRGSVEVKLHVPSPPDYLKQDMTISVDIAVARKTQALLVPVAALHDSETAAPWVYKVEHGRLQRQPIRLGLRSKGFCEVLTGLQAGDEVVLGNAANLSQGASIRPAVSGKAP